MIYLREAIPTDVDILYEWANDPLVRENSFNSALIPYDTHVKWFNRIMNDTGTLQYILMNDEIPVGQIRLAVISDEAEISYSISPHYRKQGYGHKILKLIKQETKQKHPEIKKFIAKVKIENMASRKLFESENYRAAYICYDLDISAE